MIGDHSAGLLGYRPPELQRSSLSGLWHPDDIQECWKKSPHGYLTLTEGVVVHRLKTKAGDYLWFETVCKHVINNEETWGKEMVLVSREITERKQAEYALLREQEQLTVTLKSITDGVISTNLQKQIVLMNPIAENLTGWTLVEARGKSLEEIFCIIGSCDDIIPKGTCKFDLQDVILRSRSGNNISIEGSCAPILHFDNSVTGYLVVFRDQTENSIYHCPTAEDRHDWVNLLRAQWRVRD